MAVSRVQRWRKGTLGQILQITPCLLPGSKTPPVLVTAPEHVLLAVQMCLPALWDLTLRMGASLVTPLMLPEFPR